MGDRILRNKFCFQLLVFNKRVYSLAPSPVVPVGPAQACCRPSSGLSHPRTQGALMWARVDGSHRRRNKRNLVML